MKTPWLGKGAAIIPKLAPTASPYRAAGDERGERRSDKRNSRAARPPRTGWRGSAIPRSMSVSWSASGSRSSASSLDDIDDEPDHRAALVAAASTRPRPRSSSWPAIAPSAVATRRPLQAERCTRSSATSRAPRSISSAASGDLPAPEAPRISTPFAPTSTAVAVDRLAHAARLSPGAGRTTVKRAPSTAVAATPVLGADRAAMRLDDLPRDGEAEPGILAELVALRAVGVEALEDALDVLGADAGTVVVDDHHDPLRIAPRAGCARCRPAARRTARCRSGC